jgi:hypothetical protein
MMAWYARLLKNWRHGSCHRLGMLLLLLVVAAPPLLLPLLLTDSPLAAAIAPFATSALLVDGNLLVLLVAATAAAARLSSTCTCGSCASGGRSDTSSCHPTIQAKPRLPYTRNTAGQPRCSMMSGAVSSARMVPSWPPL